MKRAFEVKKHLSLFHKFSFRHTKQTSKNVADTTFTKGLNGQNHSSSDSHDHITISLPAKYLYTEKTNLKHGATKNHSGQSELPE